MSDLLIRNVRLNGAATDVLVKDGLFERIAPHITADVPVLDGEGMDIVPGFYNAHNHAAMTVLRGYADDMELFPWLNEHIWPAEAKMTGDDIYAGTRLAILEMIKSGTVFFNDMYWEQASVWKAIREMGIRAEIGLQYMCGSDGKLLPRVVENNRALEACVASDPSELIRICCAPHAIYTVPDEVLRQSAEEAKARGLRLHIHASETKQEVADCVKRTGKTPIAHMDDLGMIFEGTILAHCVWITPEEQKIVAEKGATIAHNPVSNMKLCSGALPFAAAKKAGCRIVIGTDGCASNNDLSMFDEMKTAALLAKLTTMDPTAGSAEEIYEAATCLGAEAFGIHGGVIAEGKVADALLIRRDLPMMIGDYHLVSNLVYAADSSVVDTTICAGKVLMHHRIVPGEAEILASARAVCEKLRRN